MLHLTYTQAENSNLKFNLIQKCSLFRASEVCMNGSALWYIDVVCVCQSYRQSMAHEGTKLGDNSQGSILTIELSSLLFVDKVGMQIKDLQPSGQCCTKAMFRNVH